jgi:hypothetical protein
MPATMIAEHDDAATRVDEGQPQAGRPTGSTAAGLPVAPTVDAHEMGTYARSRTIGQLAAALAKAQGEIQGASKDKTNPHFKSSYADLASVWEACRAALSKAGLSVLQPVFADGARVTVTTIVAHGSGEWMSTDLTMTAGANTPQGVGSCITYARRYALASMVGRGARG